MTRDLRTVLGELGEREGRAASAHAPDPLTELHTVTSRVRRRRATRATASSAAVVTLVVGGALLVQGLTDGTSVTPPVATTTPTPSATTGPRPPVATRSAAPTTPAPTPSPPAAPADQPVPPTLVLGPRAAVADFGPDADAEAVVAHLTELFGAPPRDELGNETDGLVTTSGSACVTNRRPGAWLVWGDLALIVRSEDTEGNPVEPYVAGWAYPGYLTDMDAPRAELEPVELRTPEGIWIGDPLREVRAAYPQLVETSGYPSPTTQLWWTEPLDQDGQLQGYSIGTGAAEPEPVVISILSGYSCGE